MPRAWNLSLIETTITANIECLKKSYSLEEDSHVGILTIRILVRSSNSNIADSLNMFRSSLLIFLCVFIAFLYKPKTNSVYVHRYHIWRNSKSSYIRIHEIFHSIIIIVLILLRLTMRIKIVKQHREQHLCFVLFAAGFRDFEFINKALERQLKLYELTSSFKSWMTKYSNEQIRY